MKSKSKTKSKTILAWHFISVDRKLRYGDNREVRVGEILTVEGAPKLCKRGLHASVDILDALSYAPGLILCRVKVGGTVLIDDDKIVGTTRECLAMADVTAAVVEFAQWCADRARRHVARSTYADAADAANATVCVANAAVCAANAATYADYAATYADYAANAATYAGATNSANAERKAQSRKLIALVRKSLRAAAAQ